MGYVIQNAGLMPHQRVIDNVATVPVFKGQSRRAARKAAYEVLERVGLDRQARHPLSRAAVRRRTTTRRGGTRAGRRSTNPVDGRAVLGCRPRGPSRAAERNTASAKRIAQDHRLRHARHRRGAQARRPGRGVRARRCATAVRRTRAAAVAAGQRLRREVHRSRPRLSMAAAHRTRPGCRCTISSGSPPTASPMPTPAHHSRTAGRWWSTTRARRWAGSTPTGCGGTVVARRCPTASAPSVRCSARTATSARRWMRRCPRRRRSVSPSTARARSSAAYWPPTCWPRWKPDGRT